MSLRASTRALVQAGHQYSALYRGSYANHLPMALVALDHMGADDAAIARFAERYANANLEALDPGSDFAASVRDIEAAIAGRGREAVLRDAISRLAPGVGSGAFHGAIRTAYAVQADSDTEIAHALAYWSAVFAPIEASSVDGAVPSPAHALAAVHAAVGGALPAGRSIARCMAAGAADPRFPSWCAQFEGAIDLERIAPALIEIYARTGDFTLLHAVTGCHALRLLTPFASDRGALARAFWIAVVAAYAGSGARAGEEARIPAATREWSAILRDAVRCIDEHDVKLVYTCWREWQHRGHELYRHVAAATAAAGASRLAQTAS